MVAVTEAKRGQAHSPKALMLLLLRNRSRRTAAADDDGVASFDGQLQAIQQFDAAARCARDEERFAAFHRQRAHVHGVKTVHILHRRLAEGCEYETARERERVLCEC